MKLDLRLFSYWTTLRSACSTVHARYYVEKDLQWKLRYDLFSICHSTTDGLRKLERKKSFAEILVVRPNGPSFKGFLRCLRLYLEGHW